MPRVLHSIHRIGDRAAGARRPGSGQRHRRGGPPYIQQDPSHHPGQAATGAATRTTAIEEVHHTRRLTGGRAIHHTNRDPSGRANPREATTYEDATSRDQFGGGLAAENEAEEPLPEDQNEGTQEGEGKEEPMMSWSIPVSSDLITKLLFVISFYFQL